MIEKSWRVLRIWSELGVGEGRLVEEVVGRFWTWNGVWSDKVTGGWKDSASQIGVGKTNPCKK